MPQFNDPELLLLHQWTDARLLENAMEEIRNKYKVMVGQVVGEFQKNHCQFDYSKMRITFG